MGYKMCAGMVRMGRSGMIDVLNEDYITCAYATFRLFFDVFLKGIADHAHFGIFRITSGDFQCLARGSGGIAGRQEQDHKQQRQDLWAFHRVSLP